MIRRMQEQDRALFLKLTDEFYHSDATLHPIPMEYHENAFNEMMRSDVYLEGYILEHEGQSAGYALVSRTYSHEAGGPAVWLEELYVLPEYRSCGLGREFFAYLEENLPAARYRLEVEEDNERAISLYRRLDYEVLPYVQMIKDC